MLWAVSRRISYCSEEFIRRCRFGILNPKSMITGISNAMVINTIIHTDTDGCMTGILLILFHEGSGTLNSSTNSRAIIGMAGSVAMYWYRITLGMSKRSVAHTETVCRKGLGFKIRGARIPDIRIDIPITKRVKSKL